MVMMIDSVKARLRKLREWDSEISLESRYMMNRLLCRVRIVSREHLVIERNVALYNGQPDDQSHQ